MNTPADSASAEHHHHPHHPFEDDDDVMLFSDPLPENPCTLFQEWLDFARARANQPNWNTIQLATATPDGRPSVRAVLLKAYDPATGIITFYTNYRSRKATEMESNPQVAICMHWDLLERQVRVEGRVERAPAEVSDAYFASRRRESQIGAWASEQSQPLTGWEELLERVIHYGTRFGKDAVPRPPHWGGYCIVPHRFEFWHGLTGRIHERIAFERDPQQVKLPLPTAGAAVSPDTPTAASGKPTVLGGGAGAPAKAVVTGAGGADGGARWRVMWVNP